MSKQTFKDYLHATYSNRNSGAASSYLQAIRILDELFTAKGLFNLNGRSIADVRDPVLLEKIIEYVVEEEDKFRRDEDSIFHSGRTTQRSYPKKRFCSAAIRRLGEFVNQLCCAEVSAALHNNPTGSGAKLSSKLLRKFHINDKGTDREVQAKRRVGQDIFRAILLDIYGSKCCLTGIDIPEVLRASHIISWAERANTRLNPENGLCLSATYDAAFDKHLITFDEEYRLVLSPILKETYTSEAFKRHFLKFEGKAICLPTIYCPSQEFLEKHREKLIS